MEQEILNELRVACAMAADSGFDRVQVDPKHMAEVIDERNAARLHVAKLQATALTLIQAIDQDNEENLDWDDVLAARNSLFEALPEPSNA